MYDRIKEFADIIINRSIEITSYDNGNQTLFRYRYNKIINAAMKKNRYKFLHEYDDPSILRDEVIATYYESLIKVAERNDYSEEELELIENDINTEEYELTQEFVSIVQGYINTSLKNNLITSRDTQANTSYVDDILQLIEAPYQESLIDINDIPFYDSLTSTQQQFIDEYINPVYREYRNKEELIAERERVKKTLQRIGERLDKMNMPLPEDIINDILDIEDSKKFISAIRANQDKSWFSDIIISYVPAKDRIDFNSNNISNTTLFAYRKALFIALENKFN